MDWSTKFNQVIVRPGSWPCYHFCKCCGCCKFGQINIWAPYSIQYPLTFFLTPASLVTRAMEAYGAWKSRFNNSSASDIDHLLSVFLFFFIITIFFLFLFPAARANPIRSVFEIWDLLPWKILWDDISVSLILLTRLCGCFARMVKSSVDWLLILLGRRYRHTSQASSTPACAHATPSAYLRKQNLFPLGYSLLFSSPPFWSVSLFPEVLSRASESKSVKVVSGRILPVL